MNVQAKVFNDAGFATLTYDPRTFGQSDGLPRHNINFDKQSEDVFDAVTYVTSLAPQIDITRIALCKWQRVFLWSQYPLIPYVSIDANILLVGGGHGGGMDAQFYPPGLLERSRKTISQYSKKSIDKQQYVQLFPSPSEEAAANPQKALLGGPALFGFYSSIQMLADGKNCNWENKVTLESAYYNFINEFQAYLPRVSPTPLLCVRPSGDIP